MQSRDGGSRGRRSFKKNVKNALSKNLNSDKLFSNKLLVNALTEKFHRLYEVYHVKSELNYQNYDLDLNMIHLNSIIHLNSLNSRVESFGRTT